MVSEFPSQLPHLRKPNTPTSKRTSVLAQERSSIAGVTAIITMALILARCALAASRADAAFFEGAFCCLLVGGLDFVPISVEIGKG
jgi:hypothetical protein